MARDRKDATRVAEVDGFHSIIPYVMGSRTEAEVCLKTETDVTALLAWLKAQNAANGTNLKLFHAVCCAVAKTVWHRPLMNRFISGRRYWQRRDVTVSFVAKRQFADNAEESIMVLKAKPEFTVADFSKRILGDVEKVRKEGSNSLDGLMEFVGKLPRFVLEIFFWVLSRLEYHGIMPQALTDGDANYSSVLLANLGSIGAGAPYHHLNNYGTNSVMMTIGTLIEREDKDGAARSVLPVSVTLDERIGDGFYFTRSIHYFEWLLAHPEELLRPISERGEYEF